jgi:cold-inducible RNA-binding protein
MLALDCLMAPLCAARESAVCEERPQGMGTKLYVGNLSYNTTEETLREAFAGDGRQVKQVSIITDRETGRPRGFAFVQMVTDADAEAAIAALDGQQLDGRTLRVNEAREREGGGRGFAGGRGRDGGGRDGGGRDGGGRDGGGRDGGGGRGGRDRDRDRGGWSRDDRD